MTTKTEHLHASFNDLQEKQVEYDMDYRSFIVSVGRNLNGAAALDPEATDIERVKTAAKLYGVDLNKFFEDTLQLVDLNSAYTDRHPCRQVKS